MNRKLFLLSWLVLLALSGGGATAQESGPAGDASLPRLTSPPGRKPFKAPYSEISPSTIITNTTPQALAEAMDIQPSDIISGSLNGSDIRAFGIGTTPLGRYFPTAGNTFAILSTGLAESAELPNNEENLSFILDGLNNSQGEDLVQLALRLRVPDTMNCLNVDLAFYSEEFPEFVGSQFNDTFTAELGGTNLVISGTQVIAPLNFAFDTAGNIISVNTVFGVTPDTVSTYDGVTPPLRSRTPVTPSATIDVVFSVQDLGDSEWDSAVLLDNFFWSNPGNCPPGSSLTYRVFLPVVQKGP